jgi:hypothetical protein
LPIDQRPDSHLKALPDKVPLDYFDPFFFNSLPLSLRRRLAGDEPYVALPPENTMVFASPRHESEHMNTGTFMERYGDDILANYHLPAEEDEKFELLDSEDEDWLTDASSDDAEYRPDADMADDASPEDSEIVEADEALREDQMAFAMQID